MQEIEKKAIERYDKMRIAEQTFRRRISDRFDPHPIPVDTNYDGVCFVILNNDLIICHVTPIKSKITFHLVDTFPKDIIAIKKTIILVWKSKKKINKFLIMPHTTICSHSI